MSVRMYLNLGTTYQELENLDSLKVAQSVNEHGKRQSMRRMFTEKQP